MGNTSHKRFILLGSAGSGAFVENRQDRTQVGHIDHAGRDDIDEVRIHGQRTNVILARIIRFCFFFPSPPPVYVRRQQIEAVFDDVKVVDVLDSKDQSHLALMCRPELGVTFTKLHCWTLTEYEKCVFLDADTLVSGGSGGF